MTTDLDRATVEEAYARWAPVYDVVFGAVFEAGRKAATKAAEKIGGRILEFGVGTGIALPNYKRSNRFVGVDISEPMLQKARERVKKEGLPHVEGLVLMDGAHMGFADNSFDVVMAQFVITVVPQPEETLDEMARVLKPGGEIILVNHLGAEDGPRAVFEKWFARKARKLGWRPEFQFARLRNWAVRNGTVDLPIKRDVALGMYTLVRFRKRTQAEIASASESVALAG
ncbi:phosphatidylethanolamine/phosphatidyl-N-methylethanolamine N-methyltransferase [Angulomicrobium tetraedrale]|uniref:Phosphatidylethanolamine/phosphatidyl-N-methylethanolamine N-methyltransferase n=1 Tax=Ancylobacter tetraedralis TaxID=217068 RepID=A0A839ZAT9_9HYPH|nr:class I SAM-dependent methyltransferase [Ancylobacter tetraedralis]MBB3771836.1 phosphatidylethanolamine/phosphatidyl-N-methylethanolamine N-methyltransferase [Ancylobacter tetraedralis]